ncbi:MAG: AAA family ATPase [Paludibacter sp.]|nr:AAA family ATPase [Paludibacter sp.]
MQLRQSERKQAKIKLAIQGCAGSGKTYSSLLLAFGITNNWSKIAVIDSENGSADLYAHLGAYNVLNLNNNYSPENYMEAISICENSGKIDVIIIDSLSQSWDFLLEYHSGLSGNSFTNWGKITPRQNALIQKILQSKAHVICTMRTKQDYVLNQKDGKFVPEKVGLKAVQRDGLDYEFTLVFDVDIKHFAVSSKDRTGLFMGKPEFIISELTGKRILDWCNSGISVETVKNDIAKAQTLEELNSIYHQHPEWYPLLTTDFLNKKASILEAGENKPVINYLQNYIKNGNINNATNAS